MTGAEKTRRFRERRYAEIKAMAKIPCECGCGTLIAPITKKLVSARFALGHNNPDGAGGFTKGQEAWNKGRPAPWAVGRILSPEHKAKMRASRTYKRNACTICGKPVVGRGYCGPHYRRFKKYGDPAHIPDRTGANNPFYGKKHPPDVLAIIAAANTGPNNHGWQGGVAVLPYGPEFTRRYKAIIRARDGNRCRRCGMTEVEHGRTLQVHHLDHDKMNNAPNNLMTSCCRCNLWASRHRDEPWLP